MVHIIEFDTLYASYFVHPCPVKLMLMVDFLLSILVGVELGVICFGNLCNTKKTIFEKL